MMEAAASGGGGCSAIAQDASCSRSEPWFSLSRGCRAADRTQSVASNEVRGNERAKAAREEGAGAALLLVAADRRGDRRNERRPERLSSLSRLLSFSRSLSPGDSSPLKRRGPPEREGGREGARKAGTEAKAPAVPLDWGKKETANRRSEQKRERERGLSKVDFDRSRLCLTPFSLSTS